MTARKYSFIVVLGLSLGIGLLWSVPTVLAQNGDANIMLRVMPLSEDVLAAAQTVVTKLEAQSTEPVARIVNIAGRQRMLSQRLAKYYLLRELGVSSPLVTNGIETVRKDFIAAQAVLRAAPETNQDTRKLVDYMDTQWQLLDYSLEKKQGMMAEFVVLSADKILNAAEVATAAYETQGQTPPLAKHGSSDEP